MNNIHSIVGQCIGAKRNDRVKDYLKLALLYGVSLLVLLSIMIVGFAGNLSTLFLDSQEVVPIVTIYFMVVSVGYVLNTITSCYIGALNGLGKPTVGMVIMLFYYLIIRIPLAYVFSGTSLRLNGVWWAVLISHIVAAGSSIIVFYVTSSRQQRFHELKATYEN